MMRRILTAGLLLVPGLVLAAPAAQAHDGCDAATDTVIVIDAGELGGEPEAVCAHEAVGKSGLDALTAAGIDYEETRGTSPMVCRLDDQPAPADESCGAALDGEGYWAFMIATEGASWDYAMTGLGDHTVAEGEYLALVYTPMTQMDPPEVPFAADADTRAEAAAAGADTGGADSEASDESDEDGGLNVGLVVGVLAIVILAAVAVVVVRQRGDRQA